ncbi:MAG: hypothetical protein LBJ20_05775 [Candidatus Methanoplasma sp.]|nr:hypothetical protein [Candidatus Methanoplasma sp.]
MKTPDRYSLACIAVSLMIMTVLSAAGEPAEKDNIGVVYSIEKTQNGYTFMFENYDGNVMKCFSRAEPDEYIVCSIDGSMSDDDSIFFVKSMKPIFIRTDYIISKE